MNRILFCKKCSKYTLREYCDICGEKTLSPKPAKYSPEDKYSKYRIEARRERGEL